jgi:hypothetical protein
VTRGAVSYDGLDLQSRRATIELCRSATVTRRGSEEEANLYSRATWEKYLPVSGRRGFSAQWRPLRRSQAPQPIEELSPEHQAQALNKIIGKLSIAGLPPE